MSQPTPPSDQELKQKLTPEQYRVLREKATEPPFSGKYNAHYENGMYMCGACGKPLFSSQDKIESGSGWPSFTQPVAGSVGEKYDDSHGMQRTEVTCQHCGSHLGHVFDYGSGPVKNIYCINSSALDFQSKT